MYLSPPTPGLTFNAQPYQSRNSALLSIELFTYAYYRSVKRVRPRVAVCQGGWCNVHEAPRACQDNLHATSAQGPSLRLIRLSGLIPGITEPPDRL